MICWKCGHNIIYHSECSIRATGDETSGAGCSMCLGPASVWHHKFQTNLDYIEQKAKEKNLI